MFLIEPFEYDFPQFQSETCQTNGVVVARDGGSHGGDINAADSFDSFDTKFLRLLVTAATEPATRTRESSSAAPARA